MDRAASDEKIPVIVVLEDQVDLNLALASVAGLSSKDRRSVARTELRDLADRTQAPLLSFLQSEEAAGRVSQLRSLWVANGILLDAVPATIEELSQKPGIRSLIWDPPIAAEHAHDEIFERGPVGAAEIEAMRRGTELWQLENINAPQTWDRGYEGEGIIIAVQDNGVDRTHADLAGHMWNNDGEIPNNGIDDDNNGYVDDTWGWDFANGDNDPMPAPSGASRDHGTKCAGNAAGDGTEGTRTGVAPKALVMACFVSSWGQNIEGIQYAIDNGAHVISMSRSQKWRFSPKPDYDWWRSVTDGILLTGIHHANSIGNEGDNPGTDPIPFNISAPGSNPTPWAHPEQVQAGVSGITSGCGAITESDGWASFSSLGPFAWEDIGANWPEYPFEMREEYRDYPWSGGMPGLIKPDVMAPGSGTISILIGGGYGGFSGTSSSTPHIAGSMALILGAYPEITPEEMAMVLQTTAVDLGPAGKDNQFGAGKVDCLAAAILAEQMNDFGSLAGVVRDADSGDPVPGVRVEAVGTGFSVVSNENGLYSLGLPAGDFDIRAETFLFETFETSVTITAQEQFGLDIDLNALPSSSVMGTVRLENSPLTLSGVTVTVLDTPLDPVSTGLGGSYQIPALPIGTYTLVAERFGYETAQADIEVVEGESTVQNFNLAVALAAYNMEVDPGWTVGASDDDATTGVWERVDPNGTGAAPEDDHTPQPGTDCWVTGQGSPGGADGENDVDGGTTTLTTGDFNVSTSSDPVVSYWYWYSNNAGTAIDDEWLVEISDDGGSNWTELLRTTESATEWKLHEFAIADFVETTDEVRIRFVASDLGEGSIVEAGIDDFQVFGGLEPASTPTAASVVAHLKAFPNPTTGHAQVRFALTESRPVNIRVYDVGGRQVRELANGSESLDAGEYDWAWDGRDEEGRELGSGVYFFRLDTGDQVQTKSIVVTK